MINNKVPKRRFKGFTGDWEQRTLDEVANYRRGSFPQPYGNKEWYDGKESMPFVQVVDVGEDLRLVNTTKQRISKLAQPMSVFVPKETVIVTLQGSIGRVAITQYDSYLDRTILLFQEYKKHINSTYWAYIIQQKFEIEKKKAPGGTIKTITKEVLGNFMVYIPNYEEQTKIGLFFNELDSLITLHQRKLNKLEDLKISYLEKMFPQNKEVEPKFRFKGFTGDWEQRKLGEVGTTYTGLSGKTKEDFGHGNANYITYMNVFSNPISKISQVESVEIDPKQNEVAYGDIFFTTSSETPEEVGMSSVWLGNKENYYLNSFCFGYRPCITFNPYYFGYMLRNPHTRKKITLLAQGISRYNISKIQMMNIEIFIPYLDEQSKIGKIFKQLDNLITLHQCKLDKLKNLKQAYLNEMFVN